MKVLDCDGGDIALALGRELLEALQCGIARCSVSLDPCFPPGNVGDNRFQSNVGENRFRPFP